MSFRCGITDGTIRFVGAGIFFAVIAVNEANAEMHTIFAGLPIAPVMSIGIWVAGRDGVRSFALMITFSNHYGCVGAVSLFRDIIGCETMGQLTVSDGNGNCSIAVFAETFLYSGSKTGCRADYCKFGADMIERSHGDSFIVSVTVAVLVGSTLNRYIRVSAGVVELHFTCGSTGGTVLLKQVDLRLVLVGFTDVFGFQRNAVRIIDGTAPVFTLIERPGDRFVPFIYGFCCKRTDRKREHHDNRHQNDAKTLHALNLI